MNDIEKGFVMGFILGAVVSAVLICGGVSLRTDARIDKGSMICKDRVYQITLYDTLTRPPKDANDL